MSPPVRKSNNAPPPSKSGATVPCPPGTSQVKPQKAGIWSTGLCYCCDDCCNCCITCLCPCITFGQIAEIIDRGSSSCWVNAALYALMMYMTGCACFFSCFYRSKLRAQYGLREVPCKDCLVHCCCECCSLCQMYRELKRRGFDMSIGWNANMERQGHVQTTAPPPQVIDVAEMAEVDPIIEEEN